MKKTIVSVLCSAVLFLGGAAVASNSLVAQELKDRVAPEKQEKKGPPDHTVTKIMSFALSGIPDELPDPTGKMVKVDRSDLKRFLVPMDDARRIIRQAYLLSRAGLCGLDELRRKHYEDVLLFEHKRKNDKGDKQWSEYQMTYIQSLMETTNTLMTGSYAVGDEAKKADNPDEDRRVDYKCSPEKIEQARAAVEADMERLKRAQ